MVNANCILKSAGVVLLAIVVFVDVYLFSHSNCKWVSNAKVLNF